VCVSVFVFVSDIFPMSLFSRYTCIVWRNGEGGEV
jgi:hypothetical protein